MAAMNVIDALRRGIDRASFEADRLMRYNRIKAESVRLGDQIRKQTQLLGERALELYNEGALNDAKIVELAGQISDLRRRIEAKDAEAATIQAEAWPEPLADTSTTAPPSAPVEYVPVAYESDATSSMGLPAPAVMTSTCPNCGSSLRVGSLFCSRCGSKVG